MEYLPLGDLDRYLLTRLQNNESRYIIRQLLEGLEFMHDNNFAHRDLKPAVGNKSLRPIEFCS
jgi:calcium/calmodulin-dependent protein kinase I